MVQENKALSTSESDIHSSQSRIQFNDLLFSILTTLIYVFAIIIWGQGITDDSVNFLSAALSAPEKLIKIDGSPFLEWPPLFPLILSLYKITPFSPLGFATILHGIVLFFNSLLLNRLLRKLITYREISLIARTSFIFSTPLLLVHVFIWSEAIFILLFQLTFIFLERFLKTKTKTNFILLVLFTATMALQRKSGIIFSFAFFITLIMVLRPLSLIKKIGISLSYLILSSLPFLFYFFRRKVKTGQFFTHYEFQPELFKININQTLNILTSWILPDEFPLWIRIVVVLILLISFALITILSTKIIRIKLPSAIYALLILLITYLLIVGMGFIFVGNGQELDDRIFAPVFIPGMILFFLLIEKTYKKIPLLPFSRSNIIRKAMLVLLLFWLIYPISRTLYNAKVWHTRGGGGYNSPNWRNNKAINYLVQNPASIPVVTDNEFAVFYFLKVKYQQPVLLLPKEELKNKNYLYVCFNYCPFPEYQPVFKSEEGVIYRISE